MAPLVKHISWYPTQHKFPSECEPTVSDNYAATAMTGGQSYTRGLCDTAGQEDSDRLRPLSYPHTDVFLACVSVLSPSSFEKVKGKWVSEITQHCPKTFLSCFLGPKLVQRWPSTIEKLAKSKRKPIPLETAEKLAGALEAAKYVACSALTQQGLENALDEAILAALEPPPPKKGRRCVLLWASLQSPFCTAGISIILKAMLKSNSRLKIKIYFCRNDKRTAPTHVHLRETRPGGVVPFCLSTLLNFE